MLNQWEQLWEEGLRWALDFPLTIWKDHLVCCFILQIEKQASSQEVQKSHSNLATAWTSTQ